MRRPNYYNRRGVSADAAMTPLIDVVFQLLIFFIWTTSFQIAEQALPSSLSAATGTQPANPNDPPPPALDFDNVVVRILWQDGLPTWTVNNTPVDHLEQIRGRLETIARIKRDAPVILHPDKDVPLGHVIDLYDIARLVGFEKVQFTASEGEP